MVDFRKLMTAEQVAEMDAEAAETDRLFRLADRWLAEELLSLVRLVRREAEPRLGQARYIAGRTYDTSFVWGLVPEIAFRLGVPATRFVPGERDTEYAELDGDGLRDWIGETTKWLSRDVGLGRDLKVRGVRPWHLLTREMANGNPVVFALDRVAPPSPQSFDWCARHIGEISARRGHEPTMTWTPALNGPPPEEPRAAAMGM